jgi:two-component system, OmpR family, response regulator
VVEKRLRTKINFGRRCRVLCVDDNALTLHLLSLILRQQGYDVFTSPDPKTAIRVLEQRTVDLALLDYEMPQINGGELAAVVKGGGLANKVILFSGSARIPQHDLAFVDRFVQKSEGVEPLLEAIESLLPITKRPLADVQPH